MGLAVGTWATVARRPTRVATMVGGNAMVHDWITDVRKYVPCAHEGAIDGIVKHLGGALRRHLHRASIGWYRRRPSPCSRSGQPQRAITSSLAVGHSLKSKARHQTST